jgi:hypothetical protein
MVWTLRPRSWSILLLLLSLYAPVEACANTLQGCRVWILRSLSLFQKELIEPKLFDHLKRRVVFLDSGQNQTDSKIPMQALIQFSEAMDSLKHSLWTQQQKKIIEFMLNDDTLILGIDLSNRSTMVSARLDRPLLVISADKLKDQESWIHESAHWWVLNEYPEITTLYKEVLEDLQNEPNLEIATKLEGALRLWFELKANDLSFSQARSVLVTVNSYEALSLQFIRRLSLSIPKSKSQAKVFRRKLREEILNLIRWGYGIHLDEHHLKLFD